MKRKISILTLVVLFFASTTGLPLALHFCQMSETEEVCEQIMMMKKSSCCEEEQTEIYITNGIDQCCSTKLVDSSIKDNFVVSKTEFFIPLYLYTIIPIENDLPLNHYSFFKVYISPPPLIDNHLYLTNSILLI